MGTSTSLKTVVLFDGVCNLCNGSVLFIIKRDQEAKFSFASLQSSFGQSQLRNFSLPVGELNTIFLIKDEKFFKKSDAALEIAKGMSGLWPALYVFKIVPRFIRNFFYDLIAKNRYRWFGKQDACMIPTPELKARFIDF
ncbi:MAG: thiol-disulfide oxidoreductase DCC family protein [Cyclobacteriaceae bacterium]